MKRKYLILTIILSLAMGITSSCQNNSTDNKPENVYNTIITIDNNTDVSEIKNILETNNILYKINDESSAIQVTEDEYYNSIFLF